MILFSLSRDLVDLGHSPAQREVQASGRNALDLVFHTASLTVGMELKVAREEEKQVSMLKQAEEQLDDPTRGYMDRVVEIGKGLACVVDAVVFDGDGQLVGASSKTYAPEKCKWNEEWRPEYPSALSK